MATANFYLKSNPGSGERLVYLFFSYNSNRLKYSTGQKIEPPYWNEEKQRAKETRKFPQYPEFNAFLQNLENEAFNIYRRALNEGKIPTLEEFRAELDKYTGRAEIAPQKGLFAFIEQFIEERAASVNYRPESIKVYRAIYAKLKKFAGARGKKRLDFSDIDIDFWERFRDYLYGLNLTENTVHKQITTLRTILNEATEKTGVEVVVRPMKKLGVSKEPVQKLYLNLSELQTLYELDLDNNPRLSRVRDLFLIGAFTGLRFSDFTQIRPEHFQTIEGVPVFQIDTQKTGERVVIPIHPYVRAILERNGGQTPRGLSNQKMNAYLKELGELAGLDEVFVDAKKRGGVKVAKMFRRYELLCTHSARRSFATNAYKEGVPSLAIMKITGHRTEAAFMRYIQISKEENAVLMAKNAFFNLSPLRVAK